MNEFIVESKGHCFLCLNIISTDLDPSSSFQYLARYLHLDMGEVFQEGGHDISLKLLDKVQKAKMKVELCEVCTKYNNSFILAYRQLEKIQLEVRSKLDLIHQTMITSMKSWNIDSALSKMLSIEYNSNEVDHQLSAKLRITDLLRTQTMEKCFLKLNTSGPRVKVQKLTSEQLKIMTEKLRSSTIPIHGVREGMSSSGPKWEYLHNLDFKSDLLTIKKEIIPPDADIDEDHHPENVEDDHMESDSEPILSAGDDYVEKKNDPLYIAPDSPVCDIEAQECSTTRKSLGVTTSDTKPHLKKRLSMQAKAQRSRYQCTKCNNSYSRGHSLKTHQLSAHQGQKYECVNENCKKQFTVRANYNRHVRTMHQGQRFGCTFCSRTFSQPNQRNRHMKNTCPKRDNITTNVL